MAQYFIGVHDSFPIQVDGQNASHGRQLTGSAAVEQEGDLVDIAVSEIGILAVTARMTGLARKHASIRVLNRAVVIRGRR